jgi:hypothetical protein
VVAAQSPGLPLALKRQPWENIPTNDLRPNDARLLDAAQPKNQRPPTPQLLLDLIFDSLFEKCYSSQIVEVICTTNYSDELATREKKFMFFQARLTGKRRMGL